MIKDSLRALAERLSRGRILKRRLPASVGGGPIYISPEAGLRLWFKSLGKSDPELFAAAAEFIKKDAVVWDVGANIGLFTFAAAGLAGRGGGVLAIEADTDLVNLLRRSSRLIWPGRAKVTVLPVAVSDAEGIAHFQIAKRSRASNSLTGYGSDQSGGVREIHSVMTVTLDWLLHRQPPPHVLKIDVEGAEHLVLQGASHLLSEVRPIILCEVFSTNVNNVSSILRSHDYCIFDMSKPKGMRQPLDQATWNTIACPVESLHKFALGES